MEVVVIKSKKIKVESTVADFLTLFCNSNYFPHNKHTLIHVLMCLEQILVDQDRNEDAKILFEDRKKVLAAPETVTIE